MTILFQLNIEAVIKIKNGAGLDFFNFLRENKSFKF